MGVLLLQVSLETQVRRERLRTSRATVLWLVYDVVDAVVLFKLHYILKHFLAHAAFLLTMHSVDVILVGMESRSHALL